MKLVHISDTHFGTEISTVVSALLQSIQEIKPDVVILSGDITQRARFEQFAKAKAFLDQITVPKRIAIPGNHDLPLFDVFKRFTNPYGYYQKAFGKRESVWAQDGVSIVALDATSPFRHKDGKLSLSHISSLLDAGDKEVGDKTSGQMRIVVCHQPLATAWEKDASEVLRNAEAASQFFAERNVDLFISGHVHVPLYETTSNAFPALKRPFILCGAGTATSYRTRKGVPNSFNVIDVAPDGAQVSLQRYDYAAQGNMFHLFSQTKFSRSSAGWNVDF